ncbi:MAG: hypothetical protein ACI32C_00450 [Candidatus Enteromonas sp.]
MDNKPTKALAKRVIYALKKNKRKFVSLDALSRAVGIYPDVLGDQLVYFSPMIRMDPEVNCRDLLPDLLEYVKEPVKEAKPRKTGVRVSKGEMARYSSIPEFCYQRLTSVGGLVDTSAELSDVDLEILRRLVNKEIAKRKKKQNGK